MIKLKFIGWEDQMMRGEVENSKKGKNWCRDLKGNWKGKGKLGKLIGKGFN